MQRTNGESLIHVDDDGVVWDVDWLTGEALPPLPLTDDTPYTEGAYIGYEGLDCTGTEHFRLDVHDDAERVLGVQRPFRVWGLPDALYARAPAQRRVEDVCMNSGHVLADGTCLNFSEARCYPGLAVDEAIALTPPTLGWTGPLHRE